MMGVSTLTLKRVARVAAGLAGLTGAFGFLTLMGAFGPVSCWTSRSVSGRASRGGGEVVTSSEIARGCTAGIDYLYGGAGSNASVLFFWAVVLLGLVVIGGAAAWTGYRTITWLTAVAGAVVSILGILSIGWYFMLPTLFLLVAAIALTVRARRSTDGGRTTAS